MTKLPQGWTIETEERRASELDAESAFNGTHLVVYDPDGRKPPQAEWPMNWRDNATRYAWAQHAHRQAEARGEPPHPHVEPTWSGSVLPDRAGHPTPITPEDWTGLLHERPGLFARKPEAVKDAKVTGPAPVATPLPEKLPQGPTMVLNQVGDGWTYHIQHTSTDAALIGIRFDHADGRAAVALWWRRQGKDSYAFTGAVRGRHEGELVPAELNATELKAYLS